MMSHVNLVRVACMLYSLIILADIASTLPARVITGLYGPKPSIQISYPHAAQQPWTWTVDASNSTISPKLTSCITNGESATEVKIAAQGSKVLAIIGHSALVINYAPGEVVDKSVEYGVCLEGNLGNAHTLELLPDNMLAIASTGQQSDAGVWIYDSASKVNDPSPIQKVAGVRAIHGMLWDNEHGTLWVAGTTDATDGTGGTAYSTIQGYQYRNKALVESFNYTMASASQLASEWKPYAKWWDGPHDLVPVPSTRMVLIPADQDLYALNLSTGEFYSSGEQLVNEYLGGFQPVDSDRMGYDGVSRPRSDIKSVSLYRAGAAVGALYTQVEWRDEAAIPKQVNYLDANRALSVLYKGQRVYRSRWFEEVDGWRTA